MRQRNKHYSDYGITPEEEERLKIICRSKSAEIRLALMTAAIQANSGISEHIFYSLVLGLSYDRLNAMLCQKGLHIYRERNDFYADRRKCLAIFKNMCDL